MIQLDIQIPDDLKPFIDRWVSSGLFGNASDFVVNLLYNVKAQSESELSGEQQAQLATLRADIAVGIAQAERGEFVFTASEIVTEGRARRAVGMGD